MCTGSWNEEKKVYIDLETGKSFMSPNTDVSGKEIKTSP
jgi:hypothetical protein